MRRFELVEGASSKFWEVELADTSVTVRFGRIGTNGQTKTKTFASAAAAKKEHDGLIQEKTGKGYSEVGVAPGSKLAAVAAPVPAVTAPEAPVAAPLPVAPPAAETELPALDWPQGGFEWTDELRKALPVVRGIHVPALVDGRALLAQPFVFEDDVHSHYAKQFAELAAAMNSRWSYWDASTGAEKIRPESLQRKDPGFWLELCAQALAARIKRDSAALAADTYYSYYVSLALRWVTHVGVALHGLPFMVEVALDLARGVQAQTYNLARAVNSQFEPLRHHIAACSDAEHDEVIAVLDRQAGFTALDRMLRAELCPHRTDWALASFAEEAHQAELFLRDCVVPVDALQHYLRKRELAYGFVEGALLLQIHLHGSGAVELIADLLRRNSDKDNSEKYIALALRMREPRVFELLAELIERKEARAALDKLAQRHPAAVLKCVVEHALASRSRLAEGWAVRLALREPAAWARASATLGARERERFQALLNELQSADAEPEQLPQILREPPWLGKKRASELPTLDIPVRATAERIDWKEGDKARHAAYQVSPWRTQQLKAVANPAEHALTELQIAPAGRARVMAGQPLQPDDIQLTKSYYYGDSPEVVLVFPDAAGLALWNSYPPKYWYTWGHGAGMISAVLARHGEAALPGLAAFVQTYAEEGLAIAIDVDSPRLVPTALHALRNLKKAKAVAMDWLKAHAVTALTAALPLAFGKDKTLRDNAQFGLRWLSSNGFEAQAREAAAGYGGEMPQALQALLDADPLLVLPSRMPKLPGFFVAPSFRRPVLRDGGASLPATAMEHIGSMLAIGKLEAPYPGLALVKEACTAASLAEFAWDLFEAWMAAGNPSKEGWAFTALGLLGDDETARRLAPRIREWPGESAHQRAVTGLDLLAAIGSDVALMHLNGIAGKVKFKALQDRAKEKISAVADARGFTAAELADRLVPDLGLDEQGALVLDFGPRRFHVGFDETLKPFVKDEQGVRLKDLPKPNRSDDAALAEAATDRFKQLKKDAKAIATLQVMRLEMSMVERRRWSAQDFKLFFLGHPLMRHLAARVVWGVYDAQGAFASAFRVAEDWTLADAEDTQTELDEGSTVGIAHVLEMPQALQAAFGQIFADYEILQPFKQLGRETYTLTDAELRDSEIKRFENKVVATGSVMGLVNRGWERGQAQDAGWVGWFAKQVGDGLEVQFELDPGTVVGDVSFEPKQRIPRIVLRKRGTWDKDGRVSFEQLAPILASEVLRDAELLAPFKDA
jgi:predicted DNA-binding WGR domain protein